MLMRLSQGQLNVLESCPRRFQHLFLDQLGSLPTPDQQDALNWGSQFHLRMQQRELGLISDAAPETGEPLDQAMRSLIQAAPELFQPSYAFRQSEHRRSLEFQGYLLTGVYDLLILDEQQAHILDWKTYPKPQRPEWLQRNWQTRLYPFILAETSHYPPEQISMTYWFVRATSDTEPKPQSLHFPYRATQHEQTRQDLSHLLTQLTTWLQTYDAGQPFPQVDLSKGLCPTCNFVRRCQRDAIAPSQPTVDLSNIEAIQEIPI